MPYRPIACSFYDRIEAAALLGRPVRIELLDADTSVVRAVTARVLDVRARDGADWVEVEGIGLVRADRLVSLDGVPQPGAASCGLPAGSRPATD